MMNLPLNIAFFLLLAMQIGCEHVDEKGGFIFTAPRRLHSGTNESVCIVFRNVTDTVNVRVTVLEEKSDDEIASVRERISSGDKGGKCFHVSVPGTKSQKARLTLSISFATIEDYSINYSEQIFIQTPPDAVFVLTDKPVYSGGHTVKFRLFIIRSDLTHANENVERIWIENPNGVHLAQWLNESVSNGFVDKTFKLSGEPLPGSWKIIVKRSLGDITSHEFRVENYALPRFSVSLDAPKIINSSSDFNVTVCAKYIFGEPVHGDARLHAYVKCSFAFYCRNDRKSLRDDLKLDSKGCGTYKVRLGNISNFDQKIIVNATVREAGTGFEAAATAEIDIKTRIKGNGLEFSSFTKGKRFKPGLPFRGQIVKTRDSPAKESDVMLCLVLSNAKKCSKIHLQEGVANFVMSPILMEYERNFTASLHMNYADRYDKFNAKLNLIPWYSPTRSYLELEGLSMNVLKCGENATFNVIYSTSHPEKIPQFHYLVKSRGSIAANGVLTPEPDDVMDYTADGCHILGDGNFDSIKQFRFTIDIMSIFSPQSYLLVYYINPIGEVVADALALIVDECLKTPVTLKWSKNPSLPGDLNKLQIITEPNAVCALSVTDRSIKLLSKSSEFNKEFIFRTLMKSEDEFDESYYQTKCRNATSKLPEEYMDSILKIPQTDSHFVDALKAFEDFGALVISDLLLQTRPCKDDMRIEKSMGNRRHNIRTYGKRTENIMQLKGNLIDILLMRKEMPLGSELRNFFPETWIWETINISDSGKTEMDVVVPHTITEWDSEAICLSKEHGIGVADIKRMTAYQPFFLDFVFPRSIKRKEIFHVPVSVFNYEEQDLMIKITCNPSHKLSSKSKNSHSRCVKSKSKIVHEFILEPSAYGEAILTVTAEIDTLHNRICGNYTKNVRDTVSKKTFVGHEGFPVEDVKSGFICGDNKNFENEVTWNMKIPADIVESSVIVDAFVCGDILGPSLTNIDKLVTLPTGCGEQNMILLAPNILILEYLLLTKFNEPDVIEKILKNLDLGYQRQLNYRHGDGSYSAFGEKDEKGSIWLTSFVVRYLSQARKFIHIDKNDLDISVQWILGHQLENGCFPMIGKIYHRDLKGKVFEHDSSKALTAYIIISLIESGLDPKSSHMANAIYCLKGIEQSSGMYGDLLTAYALLMLGETRDAQAMMFELLKSASRAYGLIWWENDDDCSIESSVEMTSYAILCLLKLGGSHFTAAASDAVRWIMQYRNRNGGFVSSQDTILALEAISKLSSSLPRIGDSDKLLVTLETANSNVSFNLSKDNMLLQQHYSIPSYLTDVKFYAAGKGCVLVETILRYNVRRGIQNNLLKIQLKIDSVSDIDQYFVTKFNICVRQKSGSETIKMAVLEVFMVSGFYPDRTSLYNIPITSKGVRRWEEYEERVVFYFEDLKQKKTCVQFLVNQEVCVEKTNPALIKLYDYYNHKRVTTVKYSLQPECNNGSENWFNALPSEQKLESKKSIQQDDYIIQNTYPNASSVYQNFTDFVDVGYDLEVPDEIGPLPVYVPNPSNKTLGANCPLCLNVIPDIFPSLYCSAERITKVKVLNENLFEILFDLKIKSNTNQYHPEKIVFYTIKKECFCQFLEDVKSAALIIIMPTTHSQISHARQIILDNSTVIISLKQNDNPSEYLEEAMALCRT